MGVRLMVAAILLVPLVLAGQQTAVLRVRITLITPDGQSTPVARHALLISDDPVTTVPRVVRTGADGTIDVALPAGSYLVESDRAVMFHGIAYEWFQMIDLPAGQEVTLDLSTSNATVAEPSASASPAPGTDASFLFGQWNRSVVSIWSATSRATGVIVDQRGLIATHRDAVGSATSAAVQFSETTKVPGRVLISDAALDVAVIWVSPDAVSRHPPVPLDCPTTPANPLAVDDEFVTITAALGRPTDVSGGQITAVRTGGIETDLSLAFGGAGGPVFNEAGGVVGLTTMRVDHQRRWQDTRIIRTAHVCEALSAARAAMAGSTPPTPTALPVEPTRAFPTEALEGSPTSARAGASLDVERSDEFEIAIITPAAILQARQKEGWTGGRSGRAPETEARLGRLTDFGAWSDYFDDTPPVVVLRVTPKMVEGFWKRVAREAARTQGAELPPFKQFKTSFVEMTLSCGGTTIAPIHPFVLEHSLSETKIIREGVYVFDPAAFDPRCGEMRLTLRSELAPDKPETVVIASTTVTRVWDDFAGWRDARP